MPLHPSARVALMYIGDLLSAVIGTAVLESIIWQFLGRGSSLSAMTVRELMLSSVIAFLIGAAGWALRPRTTAMWVWTVPAALLSTVIVAFYVRGSGGVLQAGQAHLLSYLGLDTIGVQSYKRFTTFFVFVIPAVRGVAYSVGAIVASLVREMMTRRDAATA